MSLCLRNLSIRGWSPFLASSLSRYCFLGGNLVFSLRENWLNISGLSRNSLIMHKLTWVHIPAGTFIGGFWCSSMTRTSNMCVPDFWRHKIVSRELKKSQPNSEVEHLCMTRHWCEIICLPILQLGGGMKNLTFELLSTPVILQLLEDKGPKWSVKTK